MRKLLLFFVIAQFSWFTNTQEKSVVNISVATDTTKYVKTINYSTKRVFKDNFKERYTDKEFVYTEEKEVEVTPADLSFLKGFVLFMQTLFPFLLGGFIVFIILKLVLGSEVGFWNFIKGKKKVAEKLVYEDEDIHEVDLETLLQQAISDSNYRLAIRYYYLSILKDLSTRELIIYHKDKTNSAYTFELEKGMIRDDFSYLTYIYTYVWYGDFPINSEDFNTIHKKYSSFKKSVMK